MSERIWEQRIAFLQIEISARHRFLADPLSNASLTLQRHMSYDNLSPRNIGNIPAG